MSIQVEKGHGFFVIQSKEIFRWEKKIMRCFKKSDKTKRRHVSISDIPTLFPYYYSLENRKENLFA